ncbi:hypothetical protein [Pseudomonas sp. P8_250]|uniref:hypothetical protein n=1 Tax=Pseudomonas sp. P8_250 TaxID=3043446 RepID=UPI002A365D79|nr:hypothetical protein [Pseudomonas sp. P8_250]MDX9668749.1 hypothetical protein [Pseudomonas sp. P8_250]
MSEQVITSREKVEQHLIKQKARAVDMDNTACMYRDELGRMCAAGCLIPDDLYTPNLERRAVNLLVADGRGDIFPDDISIDELKHWQNYHDGVAQVTPTGETLWSYRRWIEGNEAHHPTLFKQALAAHYDNAKVAA